MTATFDLARLLAACAVERDARGRAELRFRYPSSPDSRLALRHVRHPVLIHTAAGGWVLRGHCLLRDAPRAFDPARIAPRLAADAAAAASDPPRGGDHAAWSPAAQTPNPPREETHDERDDH